MIRPRTGVIGQIQKYHLSASDLIETYSLPHQFGALLLKSHSGEVCSHIIGC